MKRAVILGGTGVLGRAVAWRLIKAGWAVDVTGRDGRRMPPALRKPERGLSRLNDETTPPWHR